MRGEWPSVTPNDLAIRETHKRELGRIAVCPVSNCGGTIRDRARLCWLCYSPLQQKPIDGKSRQNRAFDGPTKESTATMVAMMVALGLVCVGVFLIAPGLGIAMAIS